MNKIGHRRLLKALQNLGVSIEDLEYAGSDKDPELFTQVTGRRALPAATDECVCGVSIVHHFYVFDRAQDIVATIGSSCIENFMPVVWTDYLIRQKKACPKCRERHQCRSTHCADCRGKRLWYGRHQGKYAEDMRHERRESYLAYMRWFHDF